MCQKFQMESLLEDATSGLSLYTGPWAGQEPGNQRAEGHSSTGTEATRPDATVVPLAPMIQHRVCVCLAMIGPRLSHSVL